MIDNCQKLFIEWLANRLPEFPVVLQIKRSSRVPKGIAQRCVGIETVLAAYQWRSRWIDVDGKVHSSEDWETTKESLKHLRSWLRESLVSDSNDNTFESACYSVVSWGGGDRSGNTGARAFIAAKHEDGTLKEYFRDAFEELSLAAPRPIAGIQSMNAMLIKVHALLATDGLPIYDSRVAGAAATLLEIFARSHGLGRRDLKDLQFPSTTQSRNVAVVYPNSQSATAIWYGQSDVAIRWSTAAVRLGQTMLAVLRANPELFKDVGTESDRMHAFEASFFMMGANLKCFAEHF